MPEHELNGTQISPPLKEMACEGVTEQVGGNPLSDASLFPVRLDALPKLLPAHGLPIPTDKEKLTLASLQKLRP